MAYPAQLVSTNFLLVVQFLSLAPFFFFADCSKRRIPLKKLAHSLSLHLSPPVLSTLFQALVVRVRLVVRRPGSRGGLEFTVPNPSGGKGIYINHEASRTSNDCYVCEIAPGKKLEPQRQLFEGILITFTEVRTASRTVLPVPLQARSMAHARL